MQQIQKILSLIFQTASALFAFHFPSNLSSFKLPLPAYQTDAAKGGFMWGQGLELKFRSTLIKLEVPGSDHSPNMVVLEAGVLV